LGRSFGAADVRDGDGDGRDEAGTDGADAGPGDEAAEGVATRRSESDDEGAEHALSSPKTAMRGINRDRTGRWYD
jgi:hypothetical protein